MSETLPLFPLNAVLFPGGYLPLRIFEARYLDMVSTCLRQDSGFGVCLIRSGKEVGNAAEIHRVGTMARIIDWDKKPDGLLEIWTRGESKFEVLETSVADDQLLHGRVSYLAEEPSQPVPESYYELQRLLRQFLQQIKLPEQPPEKDQDAAWLAGRLSEWLPLPLQKKQQLLELDDPLLRLEQLQDLISCL